MSLPLSVNCTGVLPSGAGKFTNLPTRLSRIQSTRSHIHSGKEYLPSTDHACLVNPGCPVSSPPHFPEAGVCPSRGHRHCASLPAHEDVETYRLGISKLGGNFQEQQRNSLLGNSVSQVLLGTYRTILAERLRHRQPGVEKQFRRVGSIHDDLLGNTFSIHFIYSSFVRYT